MSKKKESLRFDFRIDTINVWVRIGNFAEAFYLLYLFIIFVETDKLGMARFINPFTDWGFKRIFGQEMSKDLLMNFLNELLRGEHVIRDLTFMDKELLADTKDARSCIYDIYCETDRGERIIVEMQNAYQKYFGDRTLFYAAKSIVRQGERGSWDYALAPVYVVCFMNFTAAENTLRKMRTDVMLMDKDSGTVFSQSLRMIYLSLPLFTKAAEECVNDFERWIYILKNMENLETMPFEVNEEIFERLARIADVTTLTSKERDKYEASMKVLRDNYAVQQGMLSQLNEGIKEGFEKGMKQGWEKGMEKGMEKTAMRMLAKGLSVSLISEMTGLSEGDVRNLQQKSGESHIIKQ